MKQIVPFLPATVAQDYAPRAGQHGSTIDTNRVYVVYTSFADALAAIRVAAGFAKPLAVPVILVHMGTVPYTLPVDAPTGVSPIETKAFRDQLRADGVDVRVSVFLCRSVHQMIPAAFKRRSLVVLGGRRRWPRPANRWSRMLEAASHFVVFVDRSTHGAGVCAGPSAARRRSGAGAGPQAHEENSHA